MIVTTLNKKRVVVLISGGGSNLQALIDAAADTAFPAQIVAVISNRPDAYGLTRAQQHGIDIAVVDHTLFDSRDAFDRHLQETIDSYAPDLVVLAGFMRILTPAFVTHYLGRMFNIHPSLLPLYPGLHTHRRAIAAGDKLHGATVHFVTPELDGGPAVIQAAVPVESGDTEDLLAQRVLAEEHKIYPLAVRWFAEGKVELKEGKVWYEGTAVATGGIQIN